MLPTGKRVTGKLDSHVLYPSHIQITDCSINIRTAIFWFFLITIAFNKLIQIYLCLSELGGFAMAALAKSSMVFFFMAIALVGVCYGAVYKVGDCHGWTDQGHFNYKTWLSNKHFTVGDTLVFEYDAKKENLAQVDHKGYKECKAKDPLFTFVSGNDNVKMTMPGDFFYISSIHDHCNAGQKLHIQVHASSSTPSPSQIPSFSTASPSPATSTPSASPSLSPNGYPLPSPSGSPSYNPNRSSSTITRSPPNPSPRVRPNPPPPRRRKSVIAKNQASPSNGLPIFQVLMAVAVVAYIA